MLGWTAWKEWVAELLGEEERKRLKVEGKAVSVPRGPPHTDREVRKARGAVFGKSEGQLSGYKQDCFGARGQKT